tara:strand:- start:2945 stop:4030 length:1086 start_codon:yes stop_codon:yes gene_type:complete
MFKKHLLSLKRYQTSENRDVLNGIILDRNERADHFSKKEFKNILKKIPRYSINATPDISPLYKQLSSYHKLHGNNFYVTQGITECMSQIIYSFAKKNDEIVVMKPTYPMYDVLCKLHNVKLRHWKFKKDFTLELNDLKKLINRRTKIIFLVNPNLPIEYEFSESYKKAILDLCKKKNILLVYDEAYYYFGSSSEIKNLKKYKNLIIMRTFSKAFGLSGIRLGYMIANTKICDYVSKCRTLVETNSLTYQIALWALKNQIYKKHVINVKKGSKFLIKKLRSAKEDFHGGKCTNAILIKLPNYKDTIKLTNYLSRKKIYIRNNFPKPIENYVRVSLASTAKISKFLKEYFKWKKKYIKSKKIP